MSLMRTMMMVMMLQTEMKQIPSVFHLTQQATVPQQEIRSAPVQSLQILFLPKRRLVPSQLLHSGLCKTTGFLLQWSRLAGNNPVPPHPQGCSL